MQETIGQRLKREREARYISLEKAAEDTRIRRVFIQALEADDFSVMPSAAQGRGFLRNYAEYLNLNIDELIAEIQRNPVPPAEVSGPLPQVNLAETELPPLTETEEDTAPRFWTRFLKRKPKADPAPEATQEQPVEIDQIFEGTPAIVEEEKPKTRGRKKKKVEEETVQPPVMQEEVLEESSLTEILPEVQEQAETEEEAQQGWWGRVASLFKVKFKRQDEVSEGVSLPEEEGIALPPRPIVPDKPADAIMAEIGVMLRERRELISLTVDEVERHTHLRAVFVKALEEGAFDKLPSTVQTRGMLSNYASFLDLDVDAVLLRYADALQARRREKYAETPREKIQTQVNPSMPVLRTFIAGDLLFGVVMIAVIVGLAIWGVGRIVSEREADAEPTAPPIVDVLGDAPIPTASPALTFVAVEDPSVATAEAGDETLLTPDVVVEPVTTANVSVNVFALERVFLRVSVDGEFTFEGRMAPRETMLFEANDQVVILTGDASAIRITYNGTDLGLMGGPGEVVNRVYLITGVATPTATIPPTPTNTPAVTPTFTPFPTATATAGQ